VSGLKSGGCLGDLWPLAGGLGRFLYCLSFATDFVVVFLSSPLKLGSRFETWFKIFGFPSQIHFVLISLMALR